MRVLMHDVVPVRRSEKSAARVRAPSSRAPAVAETGCRGAANPSSRKTKPRRAGANREGQAVRLLPARASRGDAAKQRLLAQRLAACGKATTTSSPWRTGRRAVLASESAARKRRALRVEGEAGPAAATARGAVRSGLAASSPDASTSSATRRGRARGRTRDEVVGHSTTAPRPSSARDRSRRARVSLGAG